MADLLAFASCTFAVAALSGPLGKYMKKVLDGEIPDFLKPLEKAVFSFAGINPRKEMDWKQYSVSMLVFNILGMVVLFLILFYQGMLPLNPRSFPGFSFDLAVNTAISFATNTNWQAYAGESAASYFTQMAGLAVQNFLSAATGICIAFALMRGMARSNGLLGNFWADLARSVLYVLLPLSIIASIFFVGSGVIQNFNNYPTATTLEGASQTIAMGPVASQEAIKVIGTNGGGFFNAGSAHPYENPTPLTNALQVILMLLIPFALVRAYGKIIGDDRQGIAILAVMVFFIVGAFAMGFYFESIARSSTIGGYAGASMEGIETRFGPGQSMMYAIAATGTSAGSVDSVEGSFTPIGGLAPLSLILLGEVAPGGVGSGMYTMIPFVIIAVFIAGLMVGRTPEYLGKKIDVVDMRSSAVIVIFPAILVLAFSGIAVLMPEGLAGLANAGPHAISTITYAFASMANNNGSAFGGLDVNTPFYNYLGAAAMLAGRFIPALAALALAGSMAKKKIWKSNEVLPTHDWFFVLWLIGVIVILGVISFLPALALGPIIEHMIMAAGGMA